MAIAVRGSWTLDHAIAKRWAQDSLDTAFRAKWISGASGYTPLNDGEARPNTPSPYCIYEKGRPVIVQHHQGRTWEDARQIQNVPVQFTIHAESKSGVSGKNIAEEMMTLVMAAYDPGRLLQMDPDCHLETFRGPDWHVREDDNTWMWAVEYEFLIEATYASRSVA